MEAVTVAQEVVALKPLGPLTQGPALHVRFVVLHQGVLKQSNGSLIVAIIIQPHCCREGALRGRPDTGSGKRKDGTGWTDLQCLYVFYHSPLHIKMHLQK